MRIENDIKLDFKDVSSGQSAALSYLASKLISLVSSHFEIVSKHIPMFL